MDDHSDVGFQPSATPNDDLGFVPTPHEAPQVGTGEALARGIENGATFGFGPAINGLLSTMLGPKNDKLGILDQYRQNRDASREAMNAASAQHPWAYGTGSFAGAAIPAILSGGASVPESGALGAIKAGAGYGALSGLGNSEADLTKGDIGGALHDTARSAALGAAISPLLQPVAKAAGELPGLLGDIGTTLTGVKTIERPAQAVVQGFKGNNVIGTKGEDTAQKAILDLVGESNPDNKFAQLEKLANGYGAQKTAMLNNAPPLATNDFMPWVTQARAATEAAINASNKNAPGLYDVDNLITSNFYNTVEDAEGNTTLVPKPNITMQQMDIFRDKLSDMGPALEAKGMSDPYAQSFAGRLAAPLKGDPDAYRKLSALGVDDNNLIPLKTFMENKVPGLTDLNGKISNLASVLKKAPSISQVLQSGKGGVNSAQAQDTVQSMLNTLKEQHPDLANSLGGDISQASTLAGLVQHANAPGLTHGWIADTARGGLIATGNVVGLTAGKLYNATPDALKSLAQNMTSNISSLGDSEVVSKVASIISQAASRDSTGRNALLFALNQNPAYRSVLRKATGEDNGRQ